MDKQRGDNNDVQTEEENASKSLHQELGLLADDSSSSRHGGDVAAANSRKKSIDDEINAAQPARKNYATTAVGVGFGIALFVNAGVLLSLPPVIRGRGAPYLPSFSKNIDAMFAQLRHHEPSFRRRPRQQRGSIITTSAGKSVGYADSQPATMTASSVSPPERIVFVDLGSGDGRIVFRAAREENMFDLCIGYEINPFLHCLAVLQKLFYWPRYRKNTRFVLGDMWKVHLGHANVVAVYGLSPIMEDLGVKLKKELKPGSYVVSNVFRIPNWKPLKTKHNTSSGCDEIYIYKTPTCWEETTTCKK